MTCVYQLFPQMFHDNKPQSSSQCPGQFWNRNWEIKIQHAKRSWTLQFLGLLSFVIFLVLLWSIFATFSPHNENFVVRPCPTCNCEVMNWSSGIQSSVVTGVPGLIMALNIFHPQLELQMTEEALHFLNLSQTRNRKMLWFESAGSILGIEIQT